MFKQALAHFSKVDPILHKVALRVREIEIITPIPKSKHFESLCEAIVSQQLSGKAADTIWGRVKKLFPKGKLTPSLVLSISALDFRKAGISWAKIKYIKNLARHTLPDLSKLTDEEVIIELTKVKGIGRWTAEMFLMFTLGREDIFSYGDLGLKNARNKLPKLQDPEVWSPYRSWASRILWRSLKL